MSYDDALLGHLLSYYDLLVQTPFSLQMRVWQMLLQVKNQNHSPSKSTAMPGRSSAIRTWLQSSADGWSSRDERCQAWNRAISLFLQ
jgi:hypothetical protein